MRIHPFIQILPIFLLGLLAACVPQSSGLRLEPCQVANLEARCGSLPVYENRAAQSGRMIPIRVTVFPAKTSPAQPDAFFYLAGGPGGAGSQFAGTAASHFAAINQTRDLVYIDQRGTGSSNLLFCPQPPSGQTEEAAFQSCLAGLPGDPRFYTTTLSMDDVDDIRQALGYDKINLYGMSYGVMAAQVYLNRHPEHVRALILDHGSLLQYAFLDHWALNSQAALDKVLARCQTDMACRSTYPTVQAEFKALVGQLDEPVATGLFDPDTIQQITFDREKFGRTIHYLLMEAQTAVKLPGLIHQAARGDWSGLAKESMNAGKASSVQLRRMVMTLEILCHEPWAGGSSEAAQRLGQGSYYLEALQADLRMLQSRHSLLPDPGEAAQHGPALAANTPVLILTGEIDPQNNLDSIAGYQELWPNSRLVVQPGVSHNYSPTPCWNTLMAEFVQRASVSNLPLACVQEVQTPTFR